MSTARSIPRARPVPSFKCSIVPRVAKPAKPSRRSIKYQYKKKTYTLKATFPEGSISEEFDAVEKIF